MNLSEIKKTDQSCFMNVFGERTPAAFVKGDGIYLYDTDGQRYSDYFAGIAVTALGHGHQKFSDSLIEHIKAGVLHTSNIYYVETQAQLAQKLTALSCADKVFFANSGAEANEGAIKLAKIFHYKSGHPEKNEIITLKSSFHGRTLTTVAATGQEKYQKPYQPLTPGFKHVDINDYSALLEAVNDKTAAIMLELIQGESGVYPVEKEYIQKVRKLCDDKGILLIVDEVQTGMGRTGKLFAYQHFGIEPDIFTLAKALGNGIPIGAVCAKDFAAKAFEPGDHGSTFGGNSFACRAALSVLEIMEEEHLIQNAEKVGAYFKEGLLKLKQNYPVVIRDVRGTGLMLGLEFDMPVAKEAGKKLFEAKMLVGTIQNTILRFLPPLIVTKEQIDCLLTELDCFCQSLDS